MTRIALDLALYGQVESYAALGPTDVVLHVDNVSSEHISGEALRIEAEDFWAPLVVALTTPGHLSQTAREEFNDHLFKTLTLDHGELSAAAFILLGSVEEFEGLVYQVAGIEFEFTAPDWESVRLICKQRIKEWGKLNYRAALVAFEVEAIGPAELIDIVPPRLLFRSDPRLLHDELGPRDKNAVVLHLLHAFLGDQRFAWIDAEELVSALDVLGSRLLGAKLPYATWALFDAFGLERLVIRPYFRLKDNSAAVLDLEQELRRKAVPPPPNVAFAASVILGAVIEAEDWDLLDESEDQVAFLQLGPLQSLEMLFVSRLEEGMYFAMRRAIEEVGFEEKAARLLLGWGERKISFTPADQAHARRL